MTSGQETEQVYSYNLGPRTGPDTMQSNRQIDERCINHTHLGGVIKLVHIPDQSLGRLHLTV